MLFDSDINQKMKKAEIFSEETMHKFNFNFGEFGFNVYDVLKMAKPILEDEFSLADVFTNQTVINEIRNNRSISEINKNYFIIVSDYLKKQKKQEEIIDNTSDLNILIEEEKKLLKELASLNERSAKVASRITEIQHLKEAECCNRSKQI